MQYYKVACKGPASSKEASMWWPYAAQQVLNRMYSVQTPTKCVLALHCVNSLQQLVLLTQQRQYAHCRGTNCHASSDAQATSLVP